MPEAGHAQPRSLTQMAISQLVSVSQREAEVNPTLD